MYPLVKLSWLDINTQAGWTSENNLDAARCFTVGYIIKETKDFYVLASTLGYDSEDTEHEEYNQRISIPKGCVILKETLCTGEGCPLVFGDKKNHFQAI